MKSLNVLLLIANPNFKNSWADPTEPFRSKLDTNSNVISEFGVLSGPGTLLDHLLHVSDEGTETQEGEVTKAPRLQAVPRPEWGAGGRLGWSGRLGLTVSGWGLGAADSGP